MEIKETVELLEGLKLVAIAAKKIEADGKVSVADLPVVVDLMKNVNVLADAVKDANLIVAEVKDLNAEEAQALLAKVLEIVAAVKAA